MTYLRKVLVIISCAAGLIAVQPVPATAENTSTDIEVDPSLQALQRIGRTLDILMQNPCTDITTKDAVFAGIHGMFRTLDPYTQFLDQENFAYMRAQQQGSFYGIGISFDVRNGELLVISPIEDSPAWKLGIRAGDVIAEIEGVSAAGITTNDVITKLRGEKGSTVEIGIRRKGEPELLHFEIVREKIELNSVRGGFFVAPGTGYVRLIEFSSTTYDELMEKLEFLKEHGMERLVLDLRFNGGGLLSAAEQVSSVFLRKDQLIVSTRGRTPGNEMTLKSRRNGEFTDLPVIVLVNDSSASASEIVAGAIQDHDRGLVLGTETHGKGLVGSQFQTGLNTAAQITTAQYFTPSGRYIQRPFDIPHRKPAEPSDTLTDAPSKKYKTDNERTVFGGGGITPDIIVEEAILSNEMFRLEADRVFFDFAVSRDLDAGSLTEDFQVSDTLLDSFFTYLEDEEIPVDIHKLREESDRVRNALRREMISVYVNTDAADKIRVLELEAIRKALELFPKIDAYLKPGAPGGSA
ncbi:MAG TPA: S41 family peptidase [bacterium]|nr:S41 family peptidase [bacterium]